VRTPSPFPQKPPYRPGGGDTARKTFAPKSGTARPSYPPRPIKPFGKKPFGKPSVKFTPAKPPKTQLATYAPQSLPKKQQATTSWGGVATWYDKHLESGDTYHEKVILPNLLRLVDAQKGEHILDLAAGQGAITRALAKAGAALTGIDISPELIALAQKKGGTGVTYQAGNAEDLSTFTNGQFDKAVIVLAIQNIEHTQKVFTEAARVTKGGGTLHIVMNHPAFRIPKQSSWAYDEKAGVQYRRVDQYLSESRSGIDMHPGMENSPQTLSFHRPLQYYVKALVKAGFVLDRFEEWISHKDSDSGPRAKAENRARKEIPLFLYLRGRKI
jgi:ubiquinone/menaquinone biosynthesis C-methylase UbiE